MTGYVLGGGVTGLAAGIASGWPVLEAEPRPGGICSSYYIRGAGAPRLYAPPREEDAYRFEIGGGHWIFGGEPDTLGFIESLGRMSRRERRATVFFPSRNLFVPYPLQAHAEILGDDIGPCADREPAAPCESASMGDWLRASFGESLCREFFYPFHELYTAGLFRRIAPQDPYKSPRNGSTKGYNNQFLYPEAGLGAVVGAMAGQCDVRYEARVAGIDLNARELRLENGTRLPYSQLISTLPLNRMLDMTGLALTQSADPWTSVLVLNVAAEVGPACPDAHWVYLPGTESGFHRVGFYSNVDPSFLPRAERGKGRVASLYVERAYLGGQRPSHAETEAYARSAVAELTSFGFIDRALIVDPTWVDIAYTWSWPHSCWRELAIEALESRGVVLAGRYARWVFQGIAESVRDGTAAGMKARSLA